MGDGCREDDEREPTGSAHSCLRRSNPTLSPIVLIVEWFWVGQSNPGSLSRLISPSIISDFIMYAADRSGAI